MEFPGAADHEMRISVQAIYAGQPRDGVGNTGHGSEEPRRGSGKILKSTGSPKCTRNGKVR